MYSMWDHPHQTDPTDGTIAHHRYDNLELR
jgi:hypothetical protein